MAGFGGAGPGMSILMGIAKGVVENDKKKREMQQEALRSRLINEQIESSQERTELARQQEDRFRQKLKFDQQQAEARAEQARREAEEYRRRVADAAAEIMRRNKGIDENVAWQEAGMVVANDADIGDFTPKDPNEGMSWSEERYWLEKKEEEEFERKMGAIYDDPSALHALSNAKTLEEVIQNAQALGIDEGAAQQFWNDSGKGRIEDPNADPTPRQYAEMRPSEQNAVDDMALLTVIKAAARADDWLAQNPESEWNREDMIRGFLHQDRRMSLKSHETQTPLPGDKYGRVLQLDDYRLAALERLDTILNEYLKENEDNLGNRFQGGISNWRK